MENYVELIHEDDCAKQKKRYHINLDFFHRPLKLDLFDIYQICDLACSSDYEVPNHKQLCYEISYIVSGEGTFYLNNTPWRVKPNMLFFSNIHEIHRIKSSRSNPLRYMCLGFSFHETHANYPKYEKLCSLFAHLKKPLVMDGYHVFELFTLALNEISAPEFLSMEMFESYILQIVVHTYRSFCAQPRNHYTTRIEMDNTMPVVYEITNYIDSNLTNIKKLSDIGAVFDYSYGYLSRIFSQTMGITLKGYYTKRRFEKAAEMLEQDISINVIIDTLHFADMSSFCKAFKLYYQVSPNKYRQHIQTKQRI